MPYYREKLLSALPPNLVSGVGAPPPPLDPSVLAGLKQTDWGLYGKSTTATRKSASDDFNPSSKKAEVPKFLSEKARESAMSSSLEPAAEITAQQPTDPMNNELDCNKPEPTEMYRNLDIKYSRFGVDDFDFGYVIVFSFAAHERRPC
jgi:PAB-dependent poly(A)-specific ribonuclease subunit 2